MSPELTLKVAMAMNAAYWPGRTPEEAWKLLWPESAQKWLDQAAVAIKSLMPMPTMPTPTAIEAAAKAGFENMAAIVLPNETPDHSWEKQNAAAKADWRRTAETIINAYREEVGSP